MQLSARIFRVSHARIYHDCGNIKARALRLDLHSVCKCFAGLPARSKPRVSLKIVARAVFLPVQANRALSGRLTHKKVFPRLF